MTRPITLTLAPRPPIAIQILIVSLLPAGALLDGSGNAVLDGDGNYILVNPPT
jgi:hypothetical protein